jgi:DNA primase
MIARLTRYGVAVPALYSKGFSHNNCFGGETRFITSQGVKTLRETCGQHVEVLGSHAGWRAAEIRSFGKQPIWTLRLRRYNDEKVIRTTADHRWFKRKGRTQRVECLTRDLKAGDRLFSMAARLAPNMRPSAFGIAHGIVFGDGTYPRTTQGPGSVTLCGGKDAELLSWFPLSPRLPVEGVGVRVSDLPRTWKERPSLDESQSYLYGWLAGYFAADGTIGSHARISSACRSDLEFVRDVAARIGISTEPIRVQQRLGMGQPAESDLYSVTLAMGSLREDFFLLASHRDRFNATDRKRAAEWQVVAVEPTSDIEEVFCAVVPEGHAFTLEDNILTGNCGGFCVRSGVTQFKMLWEHYPERFLAHEAEEARTMAENPKARPFLKSKGAFTTLRDFRLKVLEPRCDVDRFDFGGCGCFVDDGPDVAPPAPIPSPLALAR